ncbi:hypothetical protein FOCC_FOCC009473 [Frankliniella occidentalis]|nr:hypothetical protein FOCC_FOCC009473 [Frankliniella occidentalis]
MDMGMVPVMLHTAAEASGMPPGMTRLLLPAISVADPAEVETLLGPTCASPTAPSDTTVLGPATELEDVSIDISCGDLDVPMTSLLALPSIVVEGDAGRSLSPVSSRSESPLSDLPAGCERFSPAFYGRQLPFTDSDGLYDAPSSAGSATVTTTRKSSSGRRRERRSPTVRSAARSPARSPPPPKLLLDVPEGHGYGREPRDRDRHSSPRKPSPKRRARNAKSSQPQRDAKAHCLRGKPAWEDPITSPLSSKPNRKISRLKTIGHQIRLEQSLSKRRQRLTGSTSPCDSQDSGEEGGVTAPLLPPAASLPVITAAAGPGATTPTSSGPRARHHRLRKQVGEPLLAPRDRMTRSVTIVPTAGANAAESAEHQACRTKPRHTD